MSSPHAAASDREADNSADEAGYQSATAIGVVSSGERFRVPETLDVIQQLITPRSLASPATQIWILTGLMTIATPYLHYRGWLPRFFFVLQFLFWRFAYNFGLGYILHAQSKWRAFEDYFKRSVKTNPTLVRALEKSVVFLDKNIPAYRIRDYPDQYNSWMVYRFLVMIILANDLIGYCALVVVCWKAPDFTHLYDILAYLLGAGLIVFALWSKADAHRVIGDYAWYWGDFFFLLDKNLVFDGIFQMFPHPMYTVGYAFMYGFMLMSKSYTVFYVSLIGHLAQLAFLTFVENPHIDKTYNTISEPSPDDVARDEALYNEEDGYLEKKEELVMLKNLNFRRGKDVLLVVVLVYVATFAYLVDEGWAHVAHHVAWRMFHTVYLGWVLKTQAEGGKWAARFYKSQRDAFEDWKRLYNVSVTVVNLTYLVCAVRMFVWTSAMLATNESRLMTFTIGAMLVGINVYVSWSVYDAIGDFGFFYGDFFVQDVPSKLNYTGIYRYLNNPDSSLGFCGYYGVALMSGNVGMFPLAVLSHGCAKAFEKIVEQPFMTRRYGTEVRKQGGLRSEMKRKRQLFQESIRRKKAEYEQGLERLKRELERKKVGYDKFLQRSEQRQKQESTAAAKAKGQ